MGFKEYNEDDLGCYSCLYHPSKLNVGYCKSCPKNFRENYKNKEDIEWLIEQAEKKWRENWGLVVCADAKECLHSKDCLVAIPHNGKYKKTNSCNGNKIEYIAFRGQDTKEKEPCEYVVVKDINLKSLVNSNIEPILLKDYLKSVNNFNLNYPEGTIISYDAYNNYESFHIELETIGFIKKVEHDPVVNDGDCFTDNEGSFYIVKNPDANVWNLVNLTGNDNYNFHSNAHPRLSNIVGKDDLKYFKPVKIKITEVEEG